MGRMIGLVVAVAVAGGLLAWLFIGPEQPLPKPQAPAKPVPPPVVQAPPAPVPVPPTPMGAAGSPGVAPAAGAPQTPRELTNLQVIARVVLPQGPRITLTNGLLTTTVGPGDTFGELRVAEVGADHMLFRDAQGGEWRRTFAELAAGSTSSTSASAASIAPTAGPFTTPSQPVASGAQPPPSGPSAAAQAAGTVPLPSAVPPSNAVPPQGMAGGATPLNAAPPQGFNSRAPTNLPPPQGFSPQVPTNLPPPQGHSPVVPTQPPPGKPKG